MGYVSLRYFSGFVATADARRDNPCSAIVSHEVETKNRERLCAKR